MKICRRIYGILAILSLSASLDGQLVCIDLDNGQSHEGTCSCKYEKVYPNLTIARPVKLTGYFFDQTGAPISFNKTVIQVRSPKDDSVLFSTELDQQGRFDLGAVPAGTFRLIAFWIHEKKVTRLPLFDQPKPVSCSSDNKCELSIVLAIHGTDLPYEFCPPR